MNRVELWIACCLCICVTSMGIASKILLLPGPMYSHCREISSLGNKLLESGHQVAIVFDSDFEHRNCYKEFATNRSTFIRPLIFKADPQAVTTSIIMSQLSENMASGKKDWLVEEMDLVKLQTRSICANVVYDRQSLLEMKQEGFDLAVVDGGFPTYCLYLITHELDIPYVSIGSNFEEFVTDRPFLPSLLTSAYLPYFNDATFFRRLHISFHLIINHATMKYYFLPIDIINKIYPDMSRQDLLNMVSKSELFLCNADLVLGVPSPIMPSHIYIGGLTTKPASPLSGEVNRVITSTVQDLVLVTFGSMFMTLPERAELALIGALKRVGANVLWKYNKDKSVGNVRCMKWLPQNDILGHPKTKLFVSHCGNNGIFEALYHGVPVLCTPLYADQFYNAARIKHWAVGESLNLLEATEDEILSAISNMLKNSAYKRNMERASAMYHSRSTTGGETAVFWIEHVLKFGGSHLRSRGSEMSTFCYLGYDIFTFVLLCAITSVLLLYKTVVSLCSCWKRRGDKEKVD